MTNLTRTISLELQAAYRNAVYVIHEDGADITFRVGQVSPKLASLLKKHGVSSAAFLTAFNPYSTSADEKENACNQNALIADIHSLGLKSVAGKGCDALNLWPSESSALALGIDLQSAELLADRYRQNAFLWISGDGALVSLNLRYSIGGPN